MYRCFGKRFLDIVLAFLILVLLFPVLLLIAAAIKLDSPGPVVFKQARIGLHGKVFNIYKFRSMRVGAEKTGSGVYSGKGDPRVTKVGRFLRASSADELLQAVNILKGDIKEAVYLGEASRFVIQLSEEHSLIVKQANLSFAQIGLRLDQSITVGWKPEDGIVLVK